MVNRWEKRQMLPSGQGQLYWHVLLREHPEVCAVVREAHERLKGLPGLDLVAPEFLHLTTLIAGFSHEITGDQMDVMVQEAGKLLAKTSPITVTLGRVLYHPEAIVLEVRPAERLLPMLEAVRAATRAATGRDGVLAHEPWTPHVTVAYSAANGPAAPIIAALGRRLPEREITIGSVSLVVQDGPETSWDWRPVAEVPFGADCRQVLPE
ncbi:2'-5' RNA ligase family protein [Streptosporangium sp. NPDC006013]|uniref:2'-5' RNA ligase family protein n=1 Tax=Streptosporangium sp. NPDC006013 TaxID=3155596 RepID=UPI0033AE6FE2